MKSPWVSRLRLEMAEQQLTSLRTAVDALKDSNAQLQELYQEEKEARREAEKKRGEPTEETASKRRIFGTDVSKRATQDARQRAIKEGKLK